MPKVKGQGQGQSNSKMFLDFMPNFSYFLDFSRYGKNANDSSYCCGVQNRASLKICNYL